MTQSSVARLHVAHPEPQSHHSFPVFGVIGERPKSALERLLSVFADVRAGEGASTLLLAVNVFLLLAAYSLMKPARDGLILTEGGAEVASYSAAAQAALLMVAVPIYGWLGTRFVRITLITIVTTFFAATLLAFPPDHYLVMGCPADCTGASPSGSVAASMLFSRSSTAGGNT